jgi:hypothetical protein
MMNKLLYALAGAVVGAAASYLISNKILSERFEEEVKEFKDNNFEHVKNLENQVKELQDCIEVYETAGISYGVIKKVAELNKQSMEDATKKIESENDRLNEIVERKNYADIHKNVEQEPAMGTDVENFTRSNRPETEEPYLISVDQFSEDNDDYRKVSCTYYTEDEVICETSHNEKIDPKHVGQEFLSMLSNSDIDIMYVRNDYLEIDYEIDKYEGSYSYEVLGEESLNE